MDVVSLNLALSGLGGLQAIQPFLYSFLQSLFLVEGSTQKCPLSMAVLSRLIDIFKYRENTL